MGWAVANYNLTQFKRNDNSYAKSAQLFVSRLTRKPMDTSAKMQITESRPSHRQRYVQWIGLALVIALVAYLMLSFTGLSAADAYYLDSTIGELALWMSEQAVEEEPESLLGRYAQDRRLALDPALLLNEMQAALLIYTGLLLLGVVIGSVLMVWQRQGYQIVLVAVLVGLCLLVFVFPPIAGNSTISLLLIAITLLSLILLLFSQHLTRVAGFFIILALFTVTWESSKAFATRLDFTISLPVDSWNYTSYPALDEAVQAVAEGEIDALLHDRRDLDELMTEYSLDDDEEAVDLTTMPYPNLRFLRRFERESSRWGFLVEPELPGRVALVVSADDAPSITRIDDLEGLRLAVIADGFAQTDFLTQSRQMILVDMKILNDLNLPHLQSIAEALMQPARRNGPLLLVRILSGAALYTWAEALLGFVIGGLFGFILGTLFAHLALLQRSLLPYVIASQTIPIIALAPMIVIWLRDTHALIPVAVISAYLTFFPVTINTLRGLQSPDPHAFDLMQSYAASRWQIMWKLRFPAALPFIFTALKVSATASVVGAIIGELPSGIRSGLGRAILDFSSDYSLVSTPKLWAAILMAASVGILFFVIVSVVEKLVLRGQQSQ